MTKVEIRKDLIKRLEVWAKEHNYTPEEAANILLEVRLDQEDLGDEEFSAS